MPGGRAVVVCDACVLINFLVVGRLDLLSENPAFRFVVTEHVIEEITDLAQKENLAAALREGKIQQIDLTDPEGLALFAELRKTLGSGEAAAIALAAQRSWAIATDDSGTRRQVESYLGRGRLLTTPGILLQAIRGGVLTVQEADGIKANLEAHRFKMSFRSFADLI